jgi:hypothetical protein
MGIIFAFTYVCTYFCTVFTLLLLFPIISPPTGASTPPLGRTCSTLLFCDFVEEEREKIKRKTAF